MTRTGSPSEVRRVEFYSARYDTDLRVDVEVEKDHRAVVVGAWEDVNGDRSGRQWEPVVLTENEDRRAMELATEE